MTRKFEKPWSTTACMQGRRHESMGCSRRLGSYLFVSTTDPLETPRVFLARFNKPPARKIDKAPQDEKIINTPLKWKEDVSSSHGGRMASRHLTLDESDLLQKSNGSPLRRGVETTAGPLILHNFCSPAWSRRSKRITDYMRLRMFLKGNTNFCWGLRSARIVRSRWPTLLVARLLAR